MSTTIKELNDRLTKQPYMAGYTPSVEDERIFKDIFGDNINTIQWVARMASYYPVERLNMPSGEKNTESDSYEK
ncbi:hypothetical protein STCU_10818 [Strigomonas culicis]|uniref:Uncharacterized protein n=1 Tax=Strigomonas culicis TaxID=28005 RepID=S9URC3_9TRYP|nr:hypothetical protein STCU_10818 [Strigomonas culicis]|eukprot:EPY17111.1 hypothetical protein STCU_10818 [Strigomonas culicis]